MRFLKLALLLVVFPVAAHAEPVQQSGLDASIFTIRPVGAVTYLDFDVGQALKDKTRARLLSFGSDWISITSRGAPMPARGWERIPVNPEIRSSLKIMQLHYKSGGKSRLTAFEGGQFKVCSPAPEGTKVDELRYPDVEDSALVALGLNKELVAFNLDEKKSVKGCAAAVWKITLLAPESMQPDERKLKDILISAGKHLAWDLQQAMDILYGIRNEFPERKSDSKARRAVDPEIQAAFRPFHDAARAALIALGVNAAERPRGEDGRVSFWTRLRLAVSDLLHGRSNKPEVPITHPAVIEAMNRVYVESNFLLVSLQESQDPEGRVRPAIGGAISHLQKLSDQIAKSLGYSPGTSGVSRSYCALMDNLSLALEKMTESLYLGLSPEELFYLNAIRKLAGQVRIAAQTPTLGDGVAAELARSELLPAWKGEGRAFLFSAFGKLAANRNPIAQDAYQVLEQFSAFLRNRPERLEFPLR